MPTFSYIVAKFIPDVVKDEPVNVGVLIQDEKTLEGKFIENFRSLAMKYHNVNVKALQGILDSFRGKHNVDYDYLTKLAKDFQYQLVFTKPRGIKEGSPQMALAKLYDAFISIEPKRIAKRPLTREQLQSIVSKEIRKTLKRKWVLRKHPVKGPIDHFEFDFAFRNGKVSDLLHTLSFEGNAKRALTLAKALALTVEYVNREQKDIQCAALIHPPKEDKKEREFYEPAVGYLKDQECAIKTEEQIPQYVTQIKRKLSHQSTLT